MSVGERVGKLIARMAEQVVSSDPADLLLAIGLGSCIGLVLLDPARAIAGLVHVVLPASRGATDEPAKYADTAVPAIVNRLTQLGASRSRLEAVLVGGAQMFSFAKRGGTAFDLGARNEAEVSAALDRARIPIRATATGGTRGRSVRVHVETGLVAVREAGAEEFELYVPGARAVAAR